MVAHAIVLPEQRPFLAVTTDTPYPNANPAYGLGRLQDVRALSCTPGVGALHAFRLDRLRNVSALSCGLRADTLHACGLGELRGIDRLFCVCLAKCREQGKCDEFLAETNMLFRCDHHS